MAPFNQRQIGYIQAIAGRQQHVTLKSGALDFQRTSENSVPAQQFPHALRKVKAFTGGSYNYAGSEADAKSLYLYTFQLADAPLGFDSRSAHQDGKLHVDDFSNLNDCSTGLGPRTVLNVFDAPVKGTYAILDQANNLLSGIDDATTPGGGTENTTASATATSAGELLRNPEHIASIYRATPDGFLNSTDIKFRFTLASNNHSATDANHPLGQDHFEFRWIVWRHKRPGLGGTAQALASGSNLEAIRDGASFRNPGYDLFMGQTGRKRGLLGFTHNAKLDKEKSSNDADTELYSGKFWDQDSSDANKMVNGALSVMFPGDDTDSDFGENGFTVDDLLTMRINKDDYVVMKDVRFFLGKEHGKSHFEDHLHWDWNDPIDTPHDDVLSSPTLNNKNYRWNMTLIGTTNGTNKVVLNNSVRWTTKMESG